MVLGPFHYCPFCERAAPDAPETIDDQRRCTGCRYRTIYGGSRGSASLPAPTAYFERNDVTIICETLHQGFFAGCSLYDPRSGSNPRLLSLANVSFGQQCLGAVQRLV